MINIIRFFYKYLFHQINLINPIRYKMVFHIASMFHHCITLNLMVCIKFFK